MRKQDHNGFTLVEVLTISAIIIALMGLLVRTVHKVQVTADHTSSVNHLKNALNSWKKGQMPAGLRRGSSALTFRDRDWDAGLRLLDYQVGECTEEGGCLRCRVRLRLRGLQDRTVYRWVTYRVETGPEPLISRA
jgi:hypothetical protein